MKISSVPVQVATHIVLTLATLFIAWEFIPEDFSYYIAFHRNTDIETNSWLFDLLAQNRIAIVLISFGIVLLYTRYFQILRSTFLSYFVSFIVIICAFFIGIYLNFILFETRSIIDNRTFMSIEDCLKFYTVGPVVVFCLLFFKAIVIILLRPDKS